MKKKPTINAYMLIWDPTVDATEAPDPKELTSFDDVETKPERPPQRMEPAISNNHPPQREELTMKIKTKIKAGIIVWSN